MARRPTKPDTPLLDMKDLLKNRVHNLVDHEQLNCAYSQTMETGRTFIGYLRVSTKAQGESGLGLEAQEKALRNFVKGASGKLSATYTETESGKRDNRPQLQAAMAHAKRTGSVLLVARLDRLSRNAAFLNTLLDANVDFMACDNPIANKLTLRILAAVAQEEREATSIRTKAALQEAKARGVKLGSNRPGHWTKETIAKRTAGLEKARPAGRKAMQDKAREEYAYVLPRIKELLASGHSLKVIAQVLHVEGHRTRSNKELTHTHIARICDREGIPRPRKERKPT